MKPKRFTLNRSGEDNEGPAIAEMELFEEPDTTVAASPNTRSSMETDIYFRVIAFKKVGGNYVYQTVADYTAAIGPPKLIQGSLQVPVGQIYRFVAYSFNKKTPIGTLPATFTWGNTPITIPDLNNDFLTFDSGDKVVTGKNYELPITFSQQLCKLTVKISPTGFTSNTFTNCTGVYIKQGGNSSSWKVGASNIDANTENTGVVNIPDNNSTTSTRIVPFAAARPITVHFGTLTVGGTPVNNMDITSSQSVKLEAGKHYTMTAQFRKKIGIQVPKTDINLGGTACTEADKQALSKINWALGNLASTGSAKNYVMAGSTDRGYIYLWQKDYQGTNVDPCTLLDESKYGSGWVTPSNATLQPMSRCTDKVLLDQNTLKAGMWFMNRTSGVFLSAAGYRHGTSGTSAESDAGFTGIYWSREESSSTNGYDLQFGSGYTTFTNFRKAIGYSVRCVKETK